MMASHIDRTLAIVKFGSSYIPAITPFGKRYVSTLSEVADLLERGLAAQAILKVATSSWPKAEEAKVSPSSFSKQNFNPDEPRGYHARWIKAGDDGSSAERSFEEVQYRGRFHDVVVDDLLKRLVSGGSKVDKNIVFTSINGISTIPDGIVLHRGAALPYLLEVKTGGDPPFTKNQMYVYPLLCVGNHAISTDPRIASFGLPVEKPLPPLDILAVHTDGPGKPLSFFNLCALFGLRK